MNALTTEQGLQKDGYKAIFVGIGMPSSKRIPIFADLTENQGFFTSKDFLPKVAKASKPGRIFMHVFFPDICKSILTSKLCKT